MASRVATHRSLLQRRHYVRQATASNHWFDFVFSRVARYRDRFGEDFCLVINGSNNIDDAYVIPFNEAKATFTEDALDHRGRWIGTVRDDVLRLTPSGHSLDLRAFHNAFELLDQ